MPAQWKPHVVRQGDFLDALAFSVGVEPAVIWDAPENEELRSKRSDPNQLCPGDLIYLPPKSRKEGQIQARGDNAYRATVPKNKVELIIETRDELGEPIAVANAKCMITGALAEAEDATTSPEGELSFEVPIWVRQVSIYVEPIHTHLLVKVGHIDDHTSSSGIIHRLSNLGYLNTEATGDTSLHRDYVDVAYEEDEADAKAQAIRAFQRDVGHDEDGQISSELNRELRSKHGS
ncbi:MAG: hypothetical protein AAF715_30500 [Myxococcota bacterium]